MGIPIRGAICMVSTYFCYNNDVQSFLPTHCALRFVAFAYDFILKGEFPDETSLVSSHRSFLHVTQTLR